ncbi:hypothetical protein COCMIDRAFT_111417 [Bipolaris oryzae ATCC 44560]|uniref:Uncharacterized protein n=1 Tax=Bipolaris oryzae ATCC 44560 TaxID=930090 RepID=W6YVG1_COCMI|nr:uncharacterized protein COCMIDRAFT_111417 [Bipolaris oryzae ATCC 44560]EUC39494.1 hypothetical protein COCMIDRAFT_111417 [Bipolaris oryzae ATCC 44560]
MGVVVVGESRGRVLGGGLSVWETRVAAVLAVKAGRGSKCGCQRAASRVGV